MADIFYKTKFDSPIGELTLCSNGENLVGLWLKGQKYFADSVIGFNIIQNDNLQIFNYSKMWLIDYFNGVKRTPRELALAPIGGEFRQMVWKELCKIPYGSTTTYGELANRIAKLRGLEKMSAQAVGGAVGHNPISIIIPCHRVVGKNGQLTGYAGGIDVKSKLLKLEGVNMNGVFLCK